MMQECATSIQSQEPCLYYVSNCLTISIFTTSLHIPRTFYTLKFNVGWEPYEIYNMLEGEN